MNKIMKLAIAAVGTGAILLFAGCSKPNALNDAIRNRIKCSQDNNFVDYKEVEYTPAKPFMHFSDYKEIVAANGEVVAIVMGMIGNGENASMHIYGSFGCDELKSLEGTMHSFHIGDIEYHTCSFSDKKSQNSFAYLIEMEKNNSRMYLCDVALRDAIISYAVLKSRGSIVELFDEIGLIKDEKILCPLANLILNDAAMRRSYASKHYSYDDLFEKLPAVEREQIAKKLMDSGLEYRGEVMSVAKYLVEDNDLGKIMSASLGCFGRKDIERIKNEQIRQSLLARKAKLVHDEFVKSGDKEKFLSDSCNAEWITDPADWLLAYKDIELTLTTLPKVEKVLAKLKTPENQRMLLRDIEAKGRALWLECLSICGDGKNSIKAERFFKNNAGKFVVADGLEVGIMGSADIQFSWLDHRLFCYLYAKELPFKEYYGGRILDWGDLTVGNKYTAVGFLNAEEFTYANSISGQILKR